MIRALTYSRNRAARLERLRHNLGLAGLDADAIFDETQRRAVASPRGFWLHFADVMREAVS